jgi:hypothetical protein
LRPSKPGSLRACGQSVATTPTVEVVSTIRVVYVVVGTTMFVGMTRVVEVVMTVKMVLVMDEIAVAGMVEVLVVVVLNIDAGMLRQEQAAEIAVVAKSSRSWEKFISGHVRARIKNLTMRELGHADLAHFAFGMNSPPAQVGEERTC